MLFDAFIFVLTILLPSFGVPLIAYYIGKKVGQRLGSHGFLRWVGSIVAFILSILFLFAISESFIQLSLAALGGSSISISLVTNVIVAPLLGFSSLVGIGFLIHTLLKLVPQKIEDKTKPKKPLLITFLVMFVLLVTPYLFWQGVLTVSSHNKRFAESIVIANLKDHCPPKNTDKCDELRPLPAVLQNKKIVMASSTYVEFDPYELQHRQLSSLDVVGFINIRPNKFPGEDIVSPQSDKSGYLSDKEFVIVRAVYSYVCEYCVDSSDGGYIILENATGYRFMAFLNSLDFSSTPTKKVSWDSQVPFDGLGKDWFLENI